MKYRSHRYPTNFPVQVRTGLGRQSAHVVDVHSDGAQLSGLRNVHRGDKIQLDVLSQTVEAIVLWSKENRVGVCFRPKLSSHLLDTLHHNNKKRHSSGYRPSVGFQHAQL